jgi:hypothetical protein
MQPVSSRLDADTLRMVDDTADANDESRAEAIRRLVERGLEYEDLQREIERLENEKRALIADREEKQELVEYVEKERSVRQRREDRRRSNIFRRAWWFVAGEPATD